MYTSSDVDSRVICATGTVSGQVQDACQGDSGGPMFYWDGSTWRQVGVVSWGRGCAVSQYPGIFTRVSAFVDFITANCPGVC
ncbi:transmembrane protease serine 5-like isoform X2 [Pollicipes pollicipes]|uniref:transmembrane protease serine 5-like isoform X2 n=1 Tax=Pollicipes pollicipes TaxID=41117 RepID=UPI001884B54D|nr:transmembrane protease serine 5-like isoform X2 [Pollicipes pollicipes]